MGYGELGRIKANMMTRPTAATPSIKNSYWEAKSAGHVLGILASLTYPAPVLYSILSIELQNSDGEKASKSIVKLRS
jgi:hypothetical protein